MRALLFWTLMLLAIFAGTSALIGSSLDPQNFTDNLQAPLASQPSQSRAALFGLGLVAITFTYRRAWLSWANDKT